MVRSASVCLILCAATVAQGQTLQQPVVGSFRASTTVSVPDGGRAVIGGVSRGGAARSQYGPFRSGVGLFHDNSQVSVGATIHDFEEMDRLSLSAAAGSHPGQNSGRDRVMQPLTEHAYQTLQRRRGSPSDVAAAGDGAPTEQAAAASESGKAERYLELGRRAEQRGEVTVARLHYRLAEKYGSTAAAERAAQLSRVAAGRRNPQNR